MDKTLDTAPWYVIHTATGSEEKLAVKLEKCLRDDDIEGGFICFVPRRIERRKRHGEYEDLKRVLFPGYVFLCTHRADEIFLILRRGGIYLNILGLHRQVSGSEDYCLSLTEEERLMFKGLFFKDGIKKDDGAKDEPSETAQVDVSTAVLIDGKLVALTGPLKGLEQYVVWYNRHKMKAVLEMNLFQRTQRFEMSVVVVGEKGAD